MDEDKDARKPSDVRDGEDPLESGGHAGPVLWAGLAGVLVLIAVVMTIAGLSAPAQKNPPVRVPARSSIESMTGRTAGIPMGGHRGPPGCTPGQWQGEVYSMDIKRDLVTIGRPFRILPPGAGYTKELNPRRLNLQLDDKGVITRSWCG